MTRAILALVISGAVAMSGTAVAAQRGNGGGPKKPGGGAVHAPKPHGQGAPKAHAAKPPKAHAPKAPKVHAANGPKNTKNTSTNTSKNSASASRRSDVTTGTSGTLSPVQQKLERNTNLARKLDGRLPSGMNVIDAAAGFRNLGQFVAAVNVSNNLGIPFSQLKSRMVDDGLSLGQAIQDLRPSADYRTEVQRAERDASIVIADYDDDGSTSAKKSKPKNKAPKSGGR